MLHLIMTAVLAAVFGTLAVDASCAMTMGTCQIQQDPIVTPFNGKNFNLTSAGTFFALQSDEMSVQVSVMEAFSDRLGRVVHSVQQVTYTCGAQVDTWDLPRIMAGGPATLKCTVGGCGVTGVVCRVALVKGSSPVENVNVQEVVYFGSTGVGGLCYRGDASCFAAGDVSGGTVPDRAAGTTVFEALSQTAVAQSGEASMEPVLGTAKTFNGAIVTPNVIPESNSRPKSVKIPASLFVPILMPPDNSLALPVVAASNNRIMQISAGRKCISIFFLLVSNVVALFSLYDLLI